ncbi:MAG: AbiH family protein, partial [Streptococcus gallolyticus]
MVRNILILGNGFDLAMKRKTSYEDFLRFLNSLSVQSSNSEEFFDTNIIDGLIQEKKIEKDGYFSKISKNLFLKYINENKSELGEKWSSIELVISDIAEAISYFKGHLEEFSPLFSNRSDKDWTKMQGKFITKRNYAALSFVATYLSSRRFDYGSMGFQKVMDVCNEEFIQA